MFRTPSVILAVAAFVLSATHCQAGDEFPNSIHGKYLRYSYSTDGGKTYTNAPGNQGKHLFTITATKLKLVTGQDYVPQKVTFFGTDRSSSTSAQFNDGLSLSILKTEGQPYIVITYWEIQGTTYVEKIRVNMVRIAP